MSYFWQIANLWASAPRVGRHINLDQLRSDFNVVSDSFALRAQCFWHAQVHLRGFSWTFVRRDWNDGYLSIDQLPLHCSLGQCKDLFKPNLGNVSGGHVYPDKGTHVSKTYKTTEWARLLGIHNHPNPKFLKHLRDLARPHQIAFQRVMREGAGLPIGLECKCAYRDAWAFVEPAPIGPFSIKPWQVTYFNVDGFYGFERYFKLEAAVEDMTRNYPTLDKGALEQCMATPQWALGLSKQALRERFAKGEINLADMLASINRLQTGAGEGVPSNPSMQASANLITNAVSG